MAMKIPGAGNPYAVDVTPNSTQNMGLVEMPDTPFSEGKIAAQIGGAIDKGLELYAKWQDKQDGLQATSLINEMKEGLSKIESDPTTGYLAQKGENAVNRLSGKSLLDEKDEEYRQLRDKLLQRAGNANVKRMVSEYYDATRIGLIDGINRHMIAQQGVIAESVSRKNTELAYKDVQSQDPTTRNSGYHVLKMQAVEAAMRKGVEVDYSQTVGTAAVMDIENHLDRGDVNGASAVLNERQEMMSAEQVQRAKRLIKKGREQVAARQAVDTAVVNYEEIYNKDSLAKDAYKRVTGKNLAPDEYAEALSLAGGDHEKAIRIAVIGIDAYKQRVAKQEEAKKEGKDLPLEDKNDPLVIAANRAARDFNSASSELDRKDGFEDVFNRVRKSNPEMDFESCAKATRKILQAHQQKRYEEQAERDEQSRICFDSINQGNDFDSIPMSAYESLPVETRKAFETYADRHKSGTLQTNTALRWNLITNDELLKNMSDQEFYSLAAEFSPKDFDDLEQRRYGLRSGEIKTPTPRQTIERQVKDAMSITGFDKPKSDNEKMLYGYALEVIVDNLQRDMASRGGAAMSDEEVTKKVAAFKAENFSLDRNWPFDSTYTIGDLMSGDAPTGSSKYDGLLNAGLRDGQGIVDPTNVNRARLLAQILLLPEAPISGANGMVEWIRVNDPAVYRDLEASAKRLYGKQQPDATSMVRAYLLASGLVKSKRLEGRKGN